MTPAKKELKGDTTLTVRMPNRVKVAVEKSAKRTKQTRNGFIVAAVREKLAELAKAA